MEKKNNSKKTNPEGASENLAPFELENSQKETHRKCIGCNNLYKRDGLIRIMKEHKTNKILLNPSSKTFGRSAYICRNKKCLLVVAKKNRLDRALRIKIDEMLIEKLKKMIN